MKGLEKKIVVIKNTGSPYIEEAYFILKGKTPLPKCDIIKEACRIVQNESSQLPNEKTLGKAEAVGKKRKIFLFLSLMILQISAICVCLYLSFYK